MKTDSSVTKAVLKALKSMHGMSKVTAEDVVGFWRDYATPSAGVPTLSPSIQPCEDQGLGTEGQGSNAVPGLALDSPVATPLVSLAATEVTGKKVAGIVLANGESIAITKWYQVTVQSAIIALSSGWSRKQRSTRAQGRSAPCSRGVNGRLGPMREAVTLPNPHGDWRVETHFSAINQIAASIRILTAAGIDPSTVAIVVVER